MPLNFRQGFFRIWVVLSGLWIAGVVVVASIEAMRSAQSVDRFSYSLRLGQLAPSDSTQVESFPEWFLTELDFPEDGITLVLPLPEPKGLWSAWEDVFATKQGAALGKNAQGPWEAYQTIVPPSAIPELIQRAKRLQMQARVKKVGTLLAVALVPPAFLLLLAFVLSRIGKRLRNPRYL